MLGHHEDESVADIEGGVMSKIVNFYTATPDQIDDGDVMVATVTCHIVRTLDDCKPVYRIYRCAYPPDEYEGIPQGMALPPEQAEMVMRAIFPVVAWAEGVPG